MTNRRDEHRKSGLAAFVPVARPLLRPMMAAVGALTLLSSAHAQQATTLRGRVEPWGLYCVDGPSRPGIDDCSLVTAVLSNDDPEAGAKLAVAVVSADGDMELTIAVPKVRYVRPGVAFSNGAGPLLRATFDECSGGGCTTVIRLDVPVLKKLLTGGRSWVEYQVTEDQTVRLSLDFTSFGDAITALYRAVGIGADDHEPRVASGPPRLTLAKVRVDIAREAGRLASVTRPAADRCQALLTGITLNVTAGLKIEDQRDFDRWMAESRACLGDAVAIVHTVPTDGAPNDGGSSIAQMQAYQVFDALREKGGQREVYLAGQDGAGVPSTAAATSAR